MKLPTRLLFLLGLGLLGACSSDGATTAEASNAETSTAELATASRPSNAAPSNSGLSDTSEGRATKPDALATAAPTQDAATDSEEDRQAVALANEIQGEVESLRGLKFIRPVKKGVYDKERLAKFLEKKMAEDEGEADLWAQQAAFRLFGLVPPDFDMKKEMTEVLLEQIGGFYDPDTQQLYVMRGFGGVLGKVLMAHELCHALEDQHFDLKAIDDRTKKEAPHDDDRVFAAHAVMEGSATDLMTRYMMRAFASDPEALKGGIDLDNPALRGEKAMSAPPIVVRPLMEMYYGGASYLARGGGMMKRAKKKDVKIAFEDPPLSSEQVLHPEKYWDPDQRDDPKAVELPDLSPALGAGWSLKGTNVLGELGVSILTSPPAPADQPPMERMMAMLMGNKSTPESEGWGGDRWAVYAGPGGAASLVWVSVWDTEKDAREMLEALGGDALVTKAQSGNTVVALFEKTPEGGRGVSPGAVMGTVFKGMKVREVHSSAPHDPKPSTASAPATSEER